MKILIFGDSFSAERYDQLVYSDFLQSDFGFETKNLAKMGSSNDLIYRTVIENCINQDPDNTFVLVGWSYYHRQEVVDADEICKKYSNYLNLVTLDWILDSGHAKSHHKELSLYSWNFPKLLVDFTTNLFMLSQWLQYKGFNYKFFSGADNSILHPWFIEQLDKHLNFYQDIKNNKNIFDINGFSIPKWAETNNIRTKHTGHLYEDGHKVFAKFVNDNFIR